MTGLIRVRSQFQLFRISSTRAIKRDRRFCTQIIVVFSAPAPTFVSFNEPSVCTQVPRKQFSQVRAWATKWTCRPSVVPGDLDAWEVTSFTNFSTAQTFPLASLIRWERQSDTAPSRRPMNVQRNDDNSNWSWVKEAITRLLHRGVPSWQTAGREILFLWIGSRKEPPLAYRFYTPVVLQRAALFRGP